MTDSISISSDEIWKSVKGYEGLYEVSNKGRIRSLDQVQHRSNGFVMCEFLVKGRILKPFKTGNKNKGQYLTVNLHKQNTDCQKKVHRLVAEAFIPNPNNYPQVDHVDGNKLNNDVNNLDWVTNEENMKRSWNIGLRTYYGENNHKAKLTKEQVTEIRNTYIKGDSVYGAKPLAKKYGVSSTNIRQIVKGEIWKKI